MIRPISVFDIGSFLIHSSRSGSGRPTRLVNGRNSATGCPRSSMMNVSPLVTALIRALVLMCSSRTVAFM